MLSVTPGAFERMKRTARLERASPEWRSGALSPMSYVRMVEYARLSRTSGLCLRTAALDPLSFGRVRYVNYRLLAALAT
jgi:hypothetical protein